MRGLLNKDDVNLLLVRAEESANDKLVLFNKPR